MRAIYFICGCLCVALGLIGAVLPLVPTVPFLLLAAFCFARSSQRVHDWLLDHPTLGPPIRDWFATGAMRRRVKWIASGSILAAFAISVALGFPPWVLLVQALVLSAVVTFIWTRPEHGASEDPGAPDPFA